MQLPGLKTCTKCGGEYPATEEFFYRRSDRPSLGAQCKGCVYARNNALRKRHPERRTAEHRRYRERYPEKSRAKTRRYRVRHRDRLLEEGRARRRTERGREKNRLYMERWRKKHPEKWRAIKRRNYAANRERINAKRRANKHVGAARHRAWKAKNPFYCRSYWNAERVRALNAEGILTPSDIVHLLKQQEGRCAYCKAKLTKGFDIDHVVPLSRGGSNWVENIALACPSCNRGKCDRSVEEWMRLLERREARPLTKTAIAP